MKYKLDTSWKLVQEVLNPLEAAVHLTLITIGTWHVFSNLNLMKFEYMAWKSKCTSPDTNKSVYSRLHTTCV